MEHGGLTVKNIDKVRDMSVEELANKIGEKGRCGFCVRKCDGGCSNCEDNIIRWLNQEVNPMPTLEVGDIVDTNNGLSYVAISPMTLVSRDQRKQCDLEDITRIIIRILQYNGDCYQTIWRADDVQHKLI